MKGKRLSALLLSAALTLSLTGTTAFAESTLTDTGTEALAVTLATDTSAWETFDNTAWLYNSANDVYYQYGVSYCANPTDTTYETFGIYVPAAYMEMESNGDGTYTCVGFTDEEVGGYTADTAPIVMPVNTAGYSAQAAPTGYASEASTYTSEGFIYFYAGCRGRTTENGGAPWGVTDLKAAIRYYRCNADSLPGDTDAIFTFGHSGGGAQSAIVGASGDSELYYPYLYSIGAAGITYDEATDTYSSSISDATCGAMSWCPITSLDTADEAYEWMMGQYDTSDSTRASGTWTSLLSEDMAESFAEYINSLTLEDEDGNVLTLTESEDGIYTSGTYYDYILEQIEYSLNDFIDSYTDSDGNFTYSSSSSGTTTPDSGLSDGDLPSGDLPDGGLSEEDLPSGSLPDDLSEGDLPDDLSDSSDPDDGLMFAEGSSVLEASSSEDDALTEYLLSLDENYGTEEAWITYDEETGWYSIRSIEDFVLYGSKSASKSVGAFDDLDLAQAENAVFGSGLSGSAHFDLTMAGLLSANAAEYAAADSSVSESDILAYAEEYLSDYETYTDSLGYSSQYRQNMYNPMYYLCEDYEGYGSSTPASYWRINTGITQSDTSLTVETNLYLALQEAADDGVVESVDFAMLWAQGHTTAERAGADSDECFIEWVNECLASASTDGDSADDDTTGEDSSDDSSNEDGSADDGTTDDGSTDDNTTEDGSADDGTTDDGSAEDDTTDDGLTDGDAPSLPDGTLPDGDSLPDGSLPDDDITDDDSSEDDGTADDGITDDGTTDDGTSDNGTTDDGTTDDGTTDDGTTDDGTSDDDTTNDTIPDTEDTQEEEVSLVTGLANLSDGWALYKDSTLVDYTGLVYNDLEHGGQEGWYYVKNGYVDFSYTGLVKYDGASNGIKAGVSGWYFVKNGNVKFSYTGLVKYTADEDLFGGVSGWYYVKNGNVKFSYTGLVKYTADEDLFGGVSGWYYVKNAYVDFSFTGLCSNEYGTWYVKNAYVRFDYTGTITCDGTTYIITNGKLA